MQAKTQAEPQTPGTPAGKRGAKPKNRTQTHPPKTPARARGVSETKTQARPRPNHKRHKAVGNPVSIARALRQPVPCR